MYYHRIKQYLSYWLRKTGQHSLHSPFIFSLYNEVIGPSKNDTGNATISSFIRELSNSEEHIDVRTFGAPAQHGRGNSRTIGSLVQHGSTSFQGRQVLTGLIRHFNCRRVFELGTSLGLTTLYLSETPDVTVITFEGNEAIASRARKHFNRFQRENIRLLTGNLDEILQGALEDYGPPDLVYLDANHRKDPTLRYAHQCLSANPFAILAVGDIHWSPEMTDTWNTLRQSEKCTVSVDLFEMGLLFFNPELTTGHYIL